jgi:hypothetical protein
LGHDQFDVLSFESTIINFLIIVVFLLSLLVFDCLALAMVMVVVVIVAGVIGVGGLSSCELLGGSSLRLRVEIFDLGLAEDAMILVSSCPTLLLQQFNSHPSVACRRSVDVRVGDDKENL